MSRYSTIVNPETGRQVSLHGALGKSILKKYNDQVGGRRKGIHTKHDKSKVKSHCRGHKDQECPSGCVQVRVTKGKRSGSTFCRKSRSRSSSRSSSRRSLGRGLREDLESSCSSYDGDEAGCNRRVKCSYNKKGKCRSSTGRYNLERRQARLGVEKERRGDRYAYASHLEGECRQYHGNPEECARSGECTYTRHGQCRKNRRSRR